MMKKPQLVKLQTKVQYKKSCAKYMIWLPWNTI